MSSFANECISVGWLFMWVYAVTDSDLQEVDDRKPAVEWNLKLPVT